MSFSWQLSADISGLTVKMKGARPIARSGLITEGKTEPKDELLKFIKASANNAPQRCDVQVSHSETDGVEILYSANTRLIFGDSTSSGKALSQIKAEISEDLVKSFTPICAEKAFFDYSFWNALTEEFLSQHRTVALNQDDLFFGSSNEAIKMGVREISVRFDAVSNTIFADISLGPSLLVWAVRKVASNEREVRILFGDIDDADWIELAAFRRAEPAKLKVPIMKEEISKKPAQTTDYASTEPAGGWANGELDLIELVAMYQSLQLAKNECWFFERKKVSHLNKLVSRVEVEIIAQIEDRFPPELDGKDS